MRRVFSIASAILLVAAGFGAQTASVMADAGSTLTGSPYNGSDGVLDSTPALAPALSDVPSGSNDNAFGQGTKEDQTSVTVVTGSIPPNKNDLLKLYTDTAVGSNSDVFLYIAWTRAVNIGSANIDIEFNQNQFTVPTVATRNVTLNRVQGDVLLLYDFGGSGTPTLSLAKWVTSGGTCLVGSDSAPCWQATGGTVVAEAQVSSDGLLGEAVLDATKSGLVPAGSCESFQQAWVKARSSTSLNAEMKDFISPGPAHFNTCGATEVIKVSDKGGGLNGATFTLADSTGTVIKTVTTATVAGTDGIACVDGLAQGTYTWTETKAPTGYAIDAPTSQTANVNGVANCTDNTAGVAPVTFHDNPLSQIEVKFTSLAGTGVTTSAITCRNTTTNSSVSPVSENGGADPVFDDTDEVYTNLPSAPVGSTETYTCTVVVDP